MLEGGVVGTQKAAAQNHHIAVAIHGSEGAGFGITLPIGIEPGFRPSCMHLSTMGGSGGGGKEWGWVVSDGVPKR